MLFPFHYTAKFWEIKALADPKRGKSNKYEQFSFKITIRMLITKFGDHPSISSVEKAV
jgi:hypothetical protein